MISKLLSNRVETHQTGFGELKIQYLSWNVKINKKIGEICWSSDWNVFELWSGDFSDKEMLDIKKGLLPKLMKVRLPEESYIYSVVV
jgi:hypothetical protein